MSEYSPQNFDFYEPHDPSEQEFMYDVRNGYGDDTVIGRSTRDTLSAPENMLWDEEVEEIIESTLGSYEEPKLKSGDTFHLKGDTYKLEMVDWAGGGLLAKKVEDNTGTILSFYDFAKRIQDDEEEQ